MTLFHSQPGKQIQQSLGSGRAVLRRAVFFLAVGIAMLGADKDHRAGTDILEVLTVMPRAAHQPLVRDPALAHDVFQIRFQTFIASQTVENMPQLTAYANPRAFQLRFQGLHRRQAVVDVMFF